MEIGYLHQVQRYCLFAGFYSQVAYQHEMVGVLAGDAFELKYVQFIICQDIIDPEGGGQAGKAAPDPGTFFQEGILQVAPDCKIGIGIGDIIQVGADQVGMGAVTYYFMYDIGLQAPVSDPFF